MDALISVIVPVYKVEKYLNDCIESILAQTYENLEIILVDDGSPDDCPVMCDQWAKREPRIQVIHKENGGLSDARNAGMKIASGRYVCFVDSDDFISKYYVEQMHTVAVENKVPLVACDMRTFYDNDQIYDRRENSSVSCVLNSEEALNDVIHGVGIRAVAWNKLYERSLLLNEEFLVGKYHEDEFFTYRIIDKAGRVGYIDEKLYYYRQREGSIMASFSERHLDALEAYIGRLELLKRKYPKLYLKDKVTFCISCTSYYCMALRYTKKEAATIKSRIQQYRKSVRFSFPEFLQVSIRDKIYIVGSRFALGLFSCILNLSRGQHDE